MRETVPIVLSGGIVGAASGAYIAAQQPTEVSLGPGVEVDAALSMGDTGVTVSYGPTEVLFPHVPVHTPLGEAAAHIDITKLDNPLTSSDSLEQYAALATQFDSGVIHPIQEAVLAHALKGASIGAIATSTTAYLALRKARTMNLKERIPAFKEKILALRGGRLATVVSIGFLALGGGASVAAAAISGGDKKPGLAVDLDPSITKRSPLFRDAQITGAFGPPINSLAREIVQSIDHADSFWEEANRNLEDALKNFEEQGGLDYAFDTGIVPMLQLSDIHCNKAYIRHFAKPLIRGFKVRLIESTGDTQTNVGTMPYESTCFPDIADILKDVNEGSEVPVTMINVMGNHDEKKSINEYIVTENGKKIPLILTLDKNNHYTTTLDGITFVGDSDPTRSTWGPTQPEDPDERASLISQQGANIAKAACKAMVNNGVPPVVLAHESPAGEETIQRGCATIVNNGHVHANLPVKVYRGENGNLVLQHTGGTAVGADGGITIYAAPKVEATATIQLYDTSLDKITGFIHCIVHTDGSVSIEKETVPDENEAVVANFDTRTGSTTLGDYGNR